MRFASGARLGPFEILSPLGAGGMGEVYRARDTRLDRTVAIKVLSSELLSPTDRKVERFRLEARAIARITHANICTLHDVGEDDSTIFLVMEYLDGSTLAQRLEDGALPLPLAIRTAIGIADALDYAHRNGVVHRDLKPANVMLTREGVKLLDFGLAKLREREEESVLGPTQSARLTDVGTIVGTIPYMAPEQIEARAVDARTDIFAFGVVLYEMVCGRRPFAGDSRASLMAAIVTAEPPVLSSLQPQTPASLERLIRRCLAKDPDDRWQTARDLAAELRWIAEAGSSAAVTAPLITRRNRRGILWGAVAGVALTAVVVAALALSMWPVTTVAAYRQVTFRKGVISSARFTPDGQSFVYSASWEGQPYGAFLGRPESPDARDLQLPESRILSISHGNEMALLFGPQNVSRGFGARTLARIPMAGGARRDILTGVMDAAWIAGSDALAVVRDPGGGRPWTVEFPAGTPVHEAPAAWSLRVSPDGSRVAFFEGPVLFDNAPNAQITMIEKSGRKTTLSRDLTGYGLAWAPSGTEVWFTATRSGRHAPQLRAVSLAGVERPLHYAPDWLVLHDVSEDGRVLLARNTIRITMACKRPGDADERDLTWATGSTVRSLSADGKILIFEDQLGAGPSGFPIFRRGLDGSPAVRIGDGLGAALSPDEKWVLSSSGEKLVLWPTGAGDMVSLPKGTVVTAGAAAWLADSQHIVFNGNTGDNKIRGYIQEIPSGLPRAITPEGVALPGRAAVRDDNFLVARVGEAWMLLPIGGGEGQPVRGLTPTDVPIQWSHQGRYLYVVERERGLRSPAVDVFRVEVPTGSRVLWKTLTPSDPVGVEDQRRTVSITPDGQSYCYSYMRRLGDLFVLDGVK